MRWIWKEQGCDGPSGFTEMKMRPLDDIQQKGLGVFVLLLSVTISNIINSGLKFNTHQLPLLPPNDSPTNNHQIHPILFSPHFFNPGIDKAGLALQVPALRLWAESTKGRRLSYPGHVNHRSAQPASPSQHP